MTDANFVFVDYECKDLVTVYDKEEEVFQAFVTDLSWSENETGKVVSNPYRAACDFAAKQAAKLGCDWGSNYNPPRW